MLHPFKRIRRERYSINDVCQMTGLTRTAIIRTEQGLYNRPPERVMALMREMSGLNSDELMEQYIEWQRLHRLESASVLIAASHRAHNFNQLMHLAFPRESQVGRAKKLCVHQSTLARYESGSILEMPEQIKEALRDCGVLGFEDAA